MFDNEVVLNEFMVRYLTQLVADITEDEMGEQPVPGFNPPRWILGHLAISTDLARRVCGGRFHCPKEWHRAFRPGSLPVEDSVPDGTKEHYLEAVTSGFAAARAACRELSPEMAARPHGFAFLADTPLVTVQHLLAHLLATHPATHVGQLSSWRRLRGRPPIGPLPDLRP